VPDVWYLAGGMTGHKDENRPAFDRIARKLRAEGYEVVNPAYLVQERGLPHHLCMAICMPHVVAPTTTGIVVVNEPDQSAWLKSIGAKAEIYTAMLLKKPVMMYDDEPSLRFALSDRYIHMGPLFVETERSHTLPNGGGLEPTGPEVISNG